MTDALHSNRQNLESDDLHEPFTWKELREITVIGAVSLSALVGVGVVLEKTVFEDSAPAEEPAPVISDHYPTLRAE